MVRRIFFYVLPMFGTQILLLTASTAGLAVLGRFGVDTLGAVAAPITLANAGFALFAGLAAGVMVLVHRARAEGDAVRVQRLIAQGVLGAIAAGILVGGIGALLAPSLLHATGVPLGELRLAIPYTQLLAVSLPATFVFAMYCAILQGLNDHRTPLVMLGASTLLFLIGLGTLRVGALSVPIASLAATLLITIAAGITLYVRRPEFRVDFSTRAVVPDWKTVHDLVRVDLPASVQLIAVALAEVAIVSIANAYGSRGGAAYVVVMQVLAYILAPAAIFATAAAASENSRRGILLMNALVAGGLTLAVYLLATPLLGTFLSDPQTLHVAKAAVFIAGWSAFALGAGNVAAAELDAHGQTVWAVLVNVAGAWLITVPCAWIFATRYGIEGLWYGYTVGYVAVAVALFAITPLLLRRPRRVREAVTARDRAG